MQEKINNATPMVAQPACVSLSRKQSKQELAKAHAAYGLAIQECDILQTKGGVLDDFSNLAPNVSGRPGFDRSHYEEFRPLERLPVKRNDILSSVKIAYEQTGTVRNIIDLMSDFACQGVRVVHPNKRIEKFYRNWFFIVGGKSRSERFLFHLYRDSAVIAKTVQTAKLRKNVRETLFKAIADSDFQLENMRGKNTPKFELPWKYVFLNPQTIEVIGGPLAAFTGNVRYGLQIPGNIREQILNPTGPIEKELVAKLPPDIKKAAKTNKLIPLDQNNTRVFHYKKSDSEDWSKPIIYSILKDIILFEKLKLADSAALDGAISNVRIFKLGSLEHEIAPTKAGVSKFAEIMESNTGVGTIDVIWGPDIELIESSTNVHEFLGEEKYKPTLMSIYAGLGIPPTLTGAFGAGGTTNNFISLKTLIKRLEYGRSVLLDFWTTEFIKVQKAMGFRLPAKIEFEIEDLGDEASEKALLIQMADRNLISDELLQRKFKNDPDMEKIRLNRETRERQSGRMVPKAGAFHEPDFMNQLKKIVLTSGDVTPSEVGLELEERKDGEQTSLEQAQDNVVKLQKMKQTQKPKEEGKKGQPGQGRPKNAKDKTKRKPKEFKPKVKASEASIKIWISDTQSKINSFLSQYILQLYGKDNLRQLTSKNIAQAENLKFGVLFNLEPLSSVDDASIIKALKTGPLASSIMIAYQDYLETVIEELGRKLTLDEQRQIQANLYYDYKGINDGEN